MINKPIAKKSFLASCRLAGNFDFLVGEWERANEAAGQQTFETWVKQNYSTYLGHSYTLSGVDTVWEENASSMQRFPVVGMR